MSRITSSQARCKVHGSVCVFTHRPPEQQDACQSQSFKMRTQKLKGQRERDRGREMVKRIKGGKEGGRERESSAFLRGAA